MLMPYLEGNSTSTHNLNQNTTLNGLGAADTSSPSPNSSSKPPTRGPTTVAAHTKMRLLSKVEQNMRQNQNQNQNQNQSVKKLINTAATGNGVVDDVDELLVPIRSKSRNSGTNKEKDARPERNLWSRDEMLEMLSIMQDINALELLNDRNIKSEHIFRHVEEIMHKRGYVKKSCVQIWTKWKFLKSTYNTTKRHCIIPKVVPEAVYRVLCKMLDSNGDDDGSECSNSRMSSHDTSNASATQPQNISDSNDAELGVEHPIFGFRLGLIKPEPVDSDYSNVETYKNVSASNSNDGYAQSDELPLEHLPCILPVKPEPDMDEPNTPPPTAPASPSPTAPSLEESTTQRVAPLRVASFAKDTPSQPTHGVLQIDRMPPVLAKPAAAKGMRTLPLQNTSSISFVHPMSKLMLPKLPAASAARKSTPLRLPREISVQPASQRNAQLNNTAPCNNSVLRLKQVPMRQTTYSLRPDRMIPDLDHQSMSPPQSPSPSSANTVFPTMLTRAQPTRRDNQHEEIVYGPPLTAASTSRQAQQQQQQQQQQIGIQQRKRRSPLTATPVPVKKTATSMQHEYTEQKMVGDIKNEEDAKQDRHQEECFEKELSDLANSLREAQREMLKDFFAQQKEFARREHEFQMKQDRMVMRALRKQSRALLRTAEQLLLETTKEKKTKVKAKTATETAQKDAQNSEKTIKIQLRDADESEIALAKAELEKNDSELESNADEESADSLDDDVDMDMDTAQLTSEASESESNVTQ